MAGASYTHRILISTVILLISIISTGISVTVNFSNFSENEVIWFSIGWRMIFYGIQIFENLISMKFRFWKDNFNAFHLLEKVIFMVFSLHFSVFCMLGPSLMNQNKFSLEVINAMVARVLFSSCWDILWCIKSNFLLKYCIQWLQDYCFPHVGTFSDESKWI